MLLSSNTMISQVSIVTTAVTAVFYYFSLLAQHVQFAIKAHNIVPCNEIFILVC